MRRIEPRFPLSHGIPRVDDRRIIGGVVLVIRNGPRWRDAPKAYGPHKTICNRFIRWSRLGVFNRIFAAPAAKGGTADRLLIDATHLEAASVTLLSEGRMSDWRPATGTCYIPPEDIVRGRWCPPPDQVFASGSTVRIFGRRRRVPRPRRLVLPRADLRRPIM